jgi:hypothetical protein
VAKYDVDIEGKLHPWESDEITPAQICELAGWSPGTEVIEVDDDNNQRTLQAGEEVHLRPGLGFAKRHKFRRG